MLSSRCCTSRSAFRSAFTPSYWRTGSMPKETDTDARPVVTADPEPRSAGQPVVDIRALRKSFGSNEVLKGIDLSVAPGEVVAVIGKSGSGKSTLLRCINGLEEFQSGSLAV